MRVALATAVLGAALVASLSSQTATRGRQTRSNGRSSNGKTAWISAPAITYLSSQDNRIRVAWSARDAATLPRVHARAEVPRARATIAADGPTNNSGLRFTIKVPNRPISTSGSRRRHHDRGHPRQKDVELHAGDLRIDVGRARTITMSTRRCGRRHSRRALSRIPRRPVPIVRLDRQGTVPAAREAEGRRPSPLLERRLIIRA